MAISYTVAKKYCR